MRIEVVFASALGHRRRALELPRGATALQAAMASGLPAELGLAPGALALGIGGERVPAGRALRDGDRVVILRPLAADPQQARRLRARRTTRSSP